jgi:ribonuclease BN (tRNA processing enzyme)
LIDDFLLIDAPCGIPQVLRRLEFDFQQLSHIVLTHLHGDHVFGLPFLLLEYMLKPRELSLAIYGPERTQSLVSGLLRFAFPEADQEKLIGGASVTYRLPPLEKTIALGEYSCQLRRVPHGPVETYGIIISDHRNMRTVFYAPDCEYHRALDNTIASVDLAILDATTFDTPVPGHMSLQQVAEYAHRYPSKRFIATHMSNFDVPQGWAPPNLMIPIDGDPIVL